MTLNPLSPRIWRAAWYLLAYQLLGGLLFSAALTAALGAAALAVTIAGIPLLIAASSVLHGFASAERNRLRQILPGRVETRYREPDRPGLIAAARTRWTDPATWHEVGYLIGMWLPLAVLGVVVFGVWAALLAGITAPLWYRYPVDHYGHGLTAHGIQLGYFPDGPHGHGAAGLYIQTLPQALLAAAVCAVLFVLFSNVLIVTARAHATVARALLRAPEDPLAEVRTTLERPGPLAPLLHQNER